MNTCEGVPFQHAEHFELFQEKNCLMNRAWSDWIQASFCMNVVRFAWKLLPVARKAKKQPETFYLHQDFQSNYEKNWQMYVRSALIF